MLKKSLILPLILLSILIFPALILAASPCTPGMSLAECQTAILGQVGNASNYGEVNQNPDLSSKIGQLISYVLAMLGVVFLVLVVISGVQWMTGGGSEEKITKARTRLVNAAIGLGIVVAAYAITFFVVSKLQTSISPQAPAQVNCDDDNNQMCLETAQDCADVPPDGGTVVLNQTCPDPSAPICCRDNTAP